MNERLSLPLFTRRDLDGFFGLLIDNIVQLLAIIALCQLLCGMNGEDARYLYAHILPGAAISILFGNLFYSWQARRLARREKRTDVTALPYGINTPSMLVFISFVMAPVYARTQDVRLAWHMGLFACLGSGLIEFIGAFVADRIRRHTPRAALLATLAGISIGFISMTFALQIFQRPLIAMVPLAIILITLFAGTPFPLGLPGGLIAVLAGTAIAWLSAGIGFQFPDAPRWLTNSPMNLEAVRESLQWSGLWLPQTTIKDLMSVIDDGLPMASGFLTVIIPMGLFNLIGSLQNIESAEASGDRFDTRTSLAANGLGTIVAACFGSCFPTTIYIGHPGWKKLGARTGYSVLNGLVVSFFCLFGVVGLINACVPQEAGIAIVLWIGVIITAQAFQTTPSRHAPAVAMGLFPAIAAWGATVVQGAFFSAGGRSLQDVLTASMSSDANGFLIHGMIVIERGYIFTCMVLAAVSAFLIDRRFQQAAIWSLIAAAFTFCGLMHAYSLEGNSIDYLLRFGATDTEGSRFLFQADGLAVGYLTFAGVFCCMGWYLRKFHPDLPDVPDHGH